MTIEINGTSTVMGLVRDGVTTEVYECKSLDAHARHLHRPAERSEWFTCNGRRRGETPDSWRTSPDVAFEFLTEDQLPPLPSKSGDNKLRPLTAEELAAEFDADALNGEDELTEWWLGRANEEAQAVIPKAVAYGSNSLMQLGRKVAQLQGRTVDDAEAMELGCWINAVQKIERWTDAVMRGERCSDDTIYDCGIYIKMTQRIRDVGSWPGV